MYEVGHNVTSKILESSPNYTVTLYSNIETQESIYKTLASLNANYLFDMRTGAMYSWGKTLESDPEKFPAPSILDMEITTICNKNCNFCYKSNTKNGKNMSFETFKKIIDIFPKTLTQVALGADYDLTSNPDLWKMMDYARDHYIIPNITMGFCDDETADKLASRCGACAISIYNPKDKAYDSVKRLTERGMTQVNIHFMIAEETYQKALEVLEDIHTDPRLSKLNAIVFLALKQKGRGIGYHPLSEEKFKVLVDKANEYQIGLGFDSCSSLKVLRALGPEVSKFVMPCEASLESSYINVDGKYSPCSFCEGSADDWVDGGLSVLNCKSPEDFINKIWNHEKTEKFRVCLCETAQKNELKCRTCPVFTV